MSAGSLKTALRFQWTPRSRPCARVLEEESRRGTLGVREEPGMLNMVDIHHPEIVESLVEATSHNGGAVALERDGQLAVVVISRGVYEELVELRAAHFEMLLDRSAAAFDHMTEDEKDAWAMEVVDEVREEMYRAGLHR